MSNARSESSRKAGFSVVELLVVIVLIAILAAMLLPALAPHHTGRRVSCANNLKQMGLVVIMYANESAGELFPPMGYYLSQEVDCNAEDELGNRIYPVNNPGTKVPLLTFMFNLEAIYPEYLPDLSVLVCPKDEDYSEDIRPNYMEGYEKDLLHCVQDDFGLALLDTSYTYLSHVIDKGGDEDCVLPYTGFGPALREHFADDVSKGAKPASVSVQVGDFYNWVLTTIKDDPANAAAILDGDFDASGSQGCSEQEYVGNGDSDTVYRIRQGIEQVIEWAETDDASVYSNTVNIPIMFDNATLDPKNFNHLPGGCNVLYMDGHVEFHKYPGEAPVSKAMLWVTQAVRTGK